MASNHIITAVHPFDLKQKISVYENGSHTETIECRFEDIESAIASLSSKYNIDTIYLVGENIFYNQKIKENLMTKYANNNFEIIIK